MSNGCGPRPPLTFPTTSAALTRACKDRLGVRPRQHALLGAAVGAAALGWGITSCRLRSAQTDDRTGLPTRRRWLTAVERRLRWCLGDLRVVLLDLDGFKAVNDEYGHSAGDLVLWETAQRITQALPARATRLGGDEFAAVVTQPRDDDVHTLEHALSAPVRLPDAELPSISASIGDVVITPRSGATASSALRAADQCMYRQKRSRRKRFPRQSAASDTYVPCPR